MTDKEILLKACQKAIDNGCPVNYFDIDFDLWFEKKLYYSVIFSHEFAQYFWVKKIKFVPFHMVGDIDPKIIKYVLFIAWKYHLKRMVMEENPLKYLEKFL